MQSNHTVSTNKIIFMVFFIAAAIMTSLFVYRSTHVATHTSDEYSSIFPAGRDIKAFELVAANETAFKPQNLLGHWTLLFFGFTHCTTVCPTTFAMLSQAYPDLQKIHPNLQVVLVSLDPQRDNVKTLANYTEKFNPAFIGVSGKTPELRKFQSQLGIFAAQEEDTSTGNYQIQHSSSILLINPQGKWVGMFKYGMSAKQFVSVFDKRVRQLASK